MAGPAHMLLVSQPRSGTTLLCSLLDSHPAVTFEREMLAEHKYRGPALRLLPLFKRFPAAYLRLRAARAVQRLGTPVYGCKVFPDHFDHRNAALLQMAGRLQRAGWQIITLQRQDLLARTVSLLMSYRTGLTHGRDQSADLTQHITFKQDFFLRAVRAVWIRDREFSQLKRALSGAVRHLEYERDLADPADQQATVQQLFTLMGVPPQPVSTRLRPAWARPYRELIEQYDQLAAAAQLLLEELEQGGRAVDDIEGYLQQRYGSNHG
jgi:LPS sulfotransferase NodH